MHFLIDLRAGVWRSLTEANSWGTAAHGHGRVALTSSKGVQPSQPFD